MTTIDLLQRYPSHKENKVKTFHNSTPGSNPSESSDAKTKVLHDMLDKSIKDLENSLPKPASQWEGTLWRSPLRPRSPSPAYSEISDSFESPARIEHCTNDLLASPISPTSMHFKGPDGWPLGIEVAMNDFHRGRLSTAILQEEGLPNRLIVRKNRQQGALSGRNGTQEGQETISSKSGLFERQDESQGQHEDVFLQPVAFQRPQSGVLFEEHGKGQDHVDCTSLKSRTSQQQSFASPQQQSGCQYQHDGMDPSFSELQQQGFARPQQQSGCQYQHDGMDSSFPERQQQNDVDTHSNILNTITLPARKYCGEDKNSHRNASTDLQPVLTNGNVPMGLGLQNAELGLSIFKPYGEEYHGYYSRTVGACLPNKNGWQNVLNYTVPRNKEIYGIAHQEELQISTLTDASDEKTDFHEALDAADGIRMESMEHEIGCYNTFEESEGTFQTTEPRVSKVSGANIDSDGFPCNTSGLLEDSLEETEDLLTNALTLNEGQPQRFTLGFPEPLDPQESSRACDKSDSMLAIPGPVTKPSTPSSSSSRVPPTLKLTINPSTHSHCESTKLSRPHPSDAESSQLTISATTMVALKDIRRKKGRLPLPALAAMRETAKSQPHFQTGPDSPENQSQAQIHPLLRSKSCSRPSSQPRNVAKDSALQYVFEDADSEGHEVEDEDSVGHQITIKRCSSFETKAQDAESSLTHTSMKDHTPLQAGKIVEGTIPRYLCREDDAENQEAEHAGTFIRQRSKLRPSNDTMRVPSLENLKPSSSFLPTASLSRLNGLSPSSVGSPGAMPSSNFQPSILPAAINYRQNPAIESPAAYNSWALTPHHHEHGSPCSTPFPAVTLPSSTVSASNSTWCSNSPTSCGMTMTPASSMGQMTGSLPTPCRTRMTPSSSFGQSAGNSPDFRRIPMTPSSSLGDIAAKKDYRRSVSFSSMFARYRKAQYHDLPTAAMTDSTRSSKESAQWGQAVEAMNDPFTSTSDSTAPFSLVIKTPSKENLADTSTRGVDRFTTPTKRSSSRFSLPRRSLSTSGRPNSNESLERALSSLVFNPLRSRPQERSDIASGHFDCTKKLDSSGSRRRPNLSIATNNANQKWEAAPSPTPLCLRDEFSMRYRPEPLEAHDHYATQKDALQGMKKGLRKVFGRL